MKKKLLLVLTMAMMLSVVGCSGKDEAEGTKAPTTVAPQATEAPSGDGEPKTLEDLFTRGYDFRGYSHTPQGYTLYFEAPTVEADMAKLADNLEGKTVAQLRDEYDMTISHSRRDDVYTFTTTIGTITYQFEIEHGVETMIANEEVSFYDLEEDDAVQNDKFENVKVVKVSYNVTLDEAAEAFLAADEEFVDMSFMEDHADRLGILEMKCELE